LIDKTLLEKVKNVILPIVIEDPNGELTHIGTGFVICAMGKHAIIITAAHVLDEAITRAQPVRHQKLLVPIPETDGPKSLFDSDYKILVFFTLKNGHSVKVEVLKAYGDEGSDLAIMMVDIPEDIDLIIDTKLIVNSKGPKVESKIIAVGFFDVKDVTSE
jgi:hypothetical protein